MLTLWRRHVKACQHRKKGRLYTKCDCPIWCDGEVDGQRVRKSMDTHDWARAVRKLAAIEDPNYGLRPCAQPGCSELVEGGRCERHIREVSRAIGAYHDAHQDVGEGTRRNRRRLLRVFQDFAVLHGLQHVHQIELEHLTSFRGVRKISPRTWTKELEILRHFFRFCLDNEWAYRNWAAKVPMPKNLKPAEREPYTPNEVTKIIAACDGIGRGPYERLRARAAVLLLRYTALRISNVSLLERNRVRNGEIFIRTTKNGKPGNCPSIRICRLPLTFFPYPAGRRGRTACISSGAATVRAWRPSATSLGRSTRRSRHPVWPAPARTDSAIRLQPRY